MPFKKERICFFFGQNLRTLSPPVLPALQLLTEPSWPCFYSREMEFWFHLPKVLCNLAHTAVEFKTFLVKYQRLFCVTDNIPLKKNLKVKEKSCNSSYNNTVFSYLLRDTVKPFLAIYKEIPESQYWILIHKCIMNKNE